MVVLVVMLNIVKDFINTQYGVTQEQFIYLAHSECPILSVCICQLENKKKKDFKSTLISK